MKVLVIWENPQEEQVARACAGEAASALGSVANRMVSRMNIHQVPITARAVSWRAMFNLSDLDLEPEVKSYIEALERSLFVEGP